MRAVVGVPLIALLTIHLGCGRSTFFATGDAGPTKGSSGTSSSGATGGGASSGGGSGVGTTAGGGSGGGSTTGGSSGGSTSGGTSSGGTTGSLSCGAGLVWHGDHCVAADCFTVAEGTPCALGDGGYASCYGGRCQYLDGCGGYGRTCSPGSSCGGCGQDRNTPCCGLPGCDSKNCPAGTICFQEFNNAFFSSCVTPTCTRDLDGRACPLPGDAGLLGNCCGSACISFHGNPDHCGGCGVACPAGTFCDQDRCAAPADCQGRNGLGCPLADGGSGFCCRGACTDLHADPLNCGGCGSVCPVGFQCTADDFGTFCYPGLLPDGGGLATGCDSDGGCPPGTACGYLGDTCFVASCGPDSEGLPCGNGPYFAACCASSCTLLYSDQNCGGSCGSSACAADQVCTYQQQSASGVACLPKDCAHRAEGAACDLNGDAGTCCAGSCKDLTTDPLNCGYCGFGCPLSVSCSIDYSGGGRPTCRAADGGTADCALLGCPPGEACVFGGCYATTCGAENSPCALDGGPDAGILFGNCCSGTCAALGTVENCSGCGIACPSSTVCTNRGCDYPSRNSTEYCGVAGAVCPVGTACAFSDCPTITCDGRPEGALCAFGPAAEVANFQSTAVGACCGGQCVNRATDPAHCGACGHSCLSEICSSSTCWVDGPTDDCYASCGADQICVLGSCVGSTCTGNSYCLAQSGRVGGCCDGSCSDFVSDPFNCGLCGIECPAGQTCQAGACSGATAPCGAGQLGRYCDLAGGSTTKVCCVGGCVDTDNDPSNCGACGEACGTGRCKGSACY